MGKAAIPAYLGDTYASASPGDRFTLFLPIWGTDRRSGEILWTTHDRGYEVRGQLRQEREVRHENKTAAIQSALTLNKDDQDRMAALARRQLELAQAPDTLSLPAMSSAPFATGLGIEHPLENGFAFLNPHGLPYLPGSSVKGVLRKAAQELSDGLFGGTAGWTGEAIQALFGLEDGEGDPCRGVLSFWDVVPQLAGNKLVVEIRTPHQSHYLQGTASPHDSGSPNPISFLAVPAGSGFTFHVRCDRPRLQRLCKALVSAQPADDPWRELLRAAFEHAFQWLGFGAKTASGYGAMQRDAKAEATAQEQARRRQEELERKRREQERLDQLARLSPVDRKIEEAKARKQPGQLDDSAVYRAIQDGLFTADEKREAAQKLQALMQALRTWRPTTAAKKPEKDKEHQRTLEVLKWLQ